MRADVRFVERSIQRKEQPITQRPQFGLLLLMKHCIATIDVIDFKGSLEIKESYEYNEVMTGKKDKKKYIALRDNVYAPYQYLMFLSDYLRRMRLNPKQQKERRVLFYPLFRIIIVGRDVKIEDCTKKGSDLLKPLEQEHIFMNTNRCFVVRSEEEAMHLVSQIDTIFKEGGIEFAKDEVIRGINNMCDKANYREMSLLPPGSLACMR